MSGIIVDRAALYLQSQPARLQSGDVLAFVILEVAASGFRVRVKSGKLKSIDPLMIQGKSNEQTRAFELEEDARRHFKEQIELLMEIGYRRTSSINKKA